MRGGRLLWHSFLICLPALAFAAPGAYFLLEIVPKLSMQQRRTVTLSYRQTATGLWERPFDATFFGQRGEGWKVSGRVGGREEQMPWGYVRSGRRVLVWIGSGKNVFGAEVDAIDTPDIETMSYVGVSAATAILIFLTAMCLRFFIGYAKERDDFVAATAHDLSTPLVALRRSVRADDRESVLLVERLVRLVENLKAYLRSGGAGLKPKLEAFSLLDACRSVYLMLRDDFRDVFDGEDVEIVADGPLVVSADRGMTEQTIWNLLGNAFKYAAPYGPVSVRIRREGCFAKLEVADEGPGLSRREAKRVFDRYYRGKEGKRGGGGGFGIGLCTAYQFARAMGGSLTVAKNSPRGCVFTLRLRLLPEVPDGAD